MYKYADVENALMRVQGLPESSRSALRARLKYMKRMGLALDTPGRGRKVIYDFSEICKWALYLEFSVFAVDPARNVKTVSFWWPIIREKIINFQGGGNLFLLGVPKALMIGNLEESKNDDRLFIHALIPHSFQLVFELDVLELGALSRLVIINVGLMRRKVELALLEVGCT